MSAEKKPFWEEKSLAQMTTKEWEMLCDGCALCCLFKIEDADTDEVFYTYVSCKMLDTDTCLCKSYPDRLEQVPQCLKIKPKNFHRMQALPETCAYRRLSENKELEDWHPLISGKPDSVHDAGISVREKAIPEENVHPDELEDFIWFKVE